MPLSPEEEGYFENLASEKLVDLDLKYRDAQHKLLTVDLNIQNQAFYEQTKNYAKEKSDGRVEAYIETVEKFNRRVSDEDYRKFAQGLKPKIIGLKEEFVNFCNRPLGPKISQYVNDRMESTLSNELQSIYAESLRPLQRLVVYGNAATLNRKVDWIFWMTALGLLIAGLSIVVSLLTPEIRRFLGLLSDVSTIK